MIHAIDALETGLYRPLRARIHEQVTELGMPVVTQIIVLPASAIKRIKNIDRLSSHARCGLGKIFPVFEPCLMHKRLRQNRRLSYLKFRIADDIVGSAIGQRRRAPEKLIQPLLMLILVIDVQRVVFVDRKLAAGIKVFVSVRGHNGRGEVLTRTVRARNDGPNCIRVFVQEMARVQIQRKLVTNNRAAEIGLIIMCF